MSLENIITLTTWRMHKSLKRKIH